MILYIDEAISLEHHGVKGMRWGVRNEEKGVRRERKAEKFDVKAEEAQKKIDALPKNKRGTYSGRNYRKKVKLTEERNQAKKDAELKRQGKLSTGQKKVAIGVGAAAAALAAYGTYRMAESGELRRLATKGKFALEGKQGLPWARKEMLASQTMGPDAVKLFVVNPINSEYGAMGTKQNCRRCTYAYEMRRRGYDVAATKSTHALGQDATGVFNALEPRGRLVRPGRGGAVTRVIQEERKVQKGTTKERPFTDFVTKVHGGLGKIKINNDSGRGVEHEIFRSLAQQPDGARGELAVRWKGGGGHSLAWEIFGGKPVIFDTQSGKKIDSDAGLIDVFKGGIAEAGFTRLDNLPLNHDFLMRWVKNA